MQGMGWGSLPEHLIRDELARGLLAPLGVEGEVEYPKVEFRIVRLASEPVAQRLWQLLQGAIY